MELGVSSIGGLDNIINTALAYEYNPEKTVFSKELTNYLQVLLKVKYSSEECGVRKSPKRDQSRMT
jgi:hypothetical protein